MAATADKFVAHVWRITDGKIAERRTFKTFGGARAFAERVSSDTGVREVSVTSPHPQDDTWGARLGVATKSGWEFTQAAELIGDIIMAAAPTKTRNDNATEEGTAVPTTTSKPASKPRAERPKITKRLTWAELLEHADGAIVYIAEKYRPQALPKGIEFADNYSDAYARFLMGNRRTLPQSQAKPFTAEELNVRKSWVRKVIAAGKMSKPPFKPVLKAAPAKAEPKPAAAPKPAAKKPAAAKPAAAKKPAAKKPAAAKAARRTSGASKTVRARKR